MVGTAGATATVAAVTAVTGKTVDAAHGASVPDSAINNVHSVGNVVDRDGWQLTAWGLCGTGGSWRAGPLTVDVFIVASCTRSSDMMHVLHILSMDHSMKSRSCRQGLVLLLLLAMKLVRLVNRSRTTHGCGSSDMWRSSRAVRKAMLRLMTGEPDWGDRMSTIWRRRPILRTVAVVAVKGAGVDKGRDLACRGRGSEH